MHLFSIRDLKAEGFNRPFCSQTRQTAMREVAAGLGKDEAMSRFAADFSLWEIGTFNKENGRLTSQEPHHVCDIFELLSNEEEIPRLAAVEE